jgi:hypothetical protein
VDLSSMQITSLDIISLTTTGIQGTNNLIF